MTKADRNAKARRARWYAEEQQLRSDLRKQMKQVEAKKLTEYLSLCAAQERAIDFVISTIK